MRRYVVRRTLSVLALAALALTSNPPTAAQAQPVDLLAGVIEGGFEGGSTGWGGVRIQSPVDRPGMQHSGARAAHVIAASPGLITLGSQYWLVPVSGRAEYTLRLWLNDDDPNTSNIKVQLEFLTAEGVPDGGDTELIGSGTTGWRSVMVSGINRETAGYVRVSVTADAAAAGATLYMDDVSLERGPLLPAFPTSTPTASATAQPTSTAPPSASATPPPTSPSATSTATASSTPSPAYPGPFDWLTNGGFDNGLYGWGDVGADVEATGGGAQLTSNSTSTKYLYQIVRVTPGAWYAGSARLLLGPGVDEAWVRVAWYVSADGAGSQLSTGDSATLTGGEGVAGEVATGPLQAPLEAHSAAVRIMLRPLGSGLARLAIDDVRFGETSAPPPPAPTAAPSAPPAPPAAPTTAPPAGGAPSTAPPPSTEGEAPPPTAGPGATPRLVAGRPVEEPSGGGASSGGRGQSGSSSSNSGSGVPLSGGPSASLAGFAPEVTLRITELMPDPPEPGSDREFEWVEVTNVGSQPLPLVGITLRDNTATLALPDIVLAPGASLVLGGPRAAVPEASVYRPPEGLFNGLGNTGDRLALLTAEGRIIDALSYGSDTTYDDPALPAPGAGRSLKRYFADDGTYAMSEVSDAPSPGRIEPAPSPTPTATAGPASERGGGSSRVAPIMETGDSRQWTNWAVPVGIGGLALLAAVGQRLWVLRRDR